MHNIDTHLYAPSQHGMKHMRLVVFVCVALSGLASACILPIIAPLMRALHLSVGQAGWMLSIGSLVMTATAAAWGSACDRLGRRPVMVVGFAGLFAAYVVFTSVAWQGMQGAWTGAFLFGALTAARALLGGFLPAVPTAAQALIADHTSQAERSAAMALIGAASGVGLVLGPALGGLLALQGLLWPLTLATVLCALACLAVPAFVPREPARPRVRAASVNPFAPGLRGWLAVAVLNWCAIVTSQVSTSFYFQDRLGLGAAQAAPLLALALTVVGVTLLVTQVVQLRWLRWPAQRMVIAGLLFWLAGLGLLLATASLGAYLLAYGLLGIGAGWVMPGAMAGASLSVPPQHQGAVAGLSAATQGIAFIVAPVGSTMLYEIDPTLPLWALILLMGLMGAWLATTRGR
ncbi:MFS transporter [Variovorax sp.]|uniref:MFS transporter n=1 Tax=Variovorax sp. TaxID=1871043 RepID=UPI002D7620BB|nr:MFS transporter [Variovorax sp.]HYP83550.1 MFS transporter [Variovorax sp.]